MTLMKEIRPVVTDEHHFNNRDETILITFCGNFGSSGFRSKSQKQQFPNQILL